MAVSAKAARRARKHARRDMGRRVTVEQLHEIECQALAGLRYDHDASLHPVACKACGTVQTNEHLGNGPTIAPELDFAHGCKLCGHEHAEYYAEAA